MVEANDLPGMALRLGGHGGLLGIEFHARGEDWVELRLPYRETLVGDPATGVLASGPMITLMDMATSFAICAKRGRLVPMATLDLRIDYLRPATPGKTVIGRGECYRLTRSVFFVRGQAYHDDIADPVAHVAGTFMNLESAA